MNFNLLLLKLSIQENQILQLESFTDIHLWTLLTCNYLNNLLEKASKEQKSISCFDHLPQFAITPNMFGNISGNNSNIYERDWSKFDQENLSQWLRYWISNPGVPCSKPLCGSKVNSAFHPSEVDEMSTRNFCELSGKK